MIAITALVVLALFLGLFLFCCFWPLLGELRAARESRQWPRVSARIVASRLVRNYDCNSMPGYHCRVRYEFSIDKKDYGGDIISFGGFRYYTRKAAEVLQERYPVGVSVPIFYAPDNPEISVLRPGFTATLSYPVVLFLAAFFVEGWVLWKLGRVALG